MEDQKDPGLPGPQPPSDPGLPRPVSGGPQPPPGPADTGAGVEIPSEFGQDEPPAPRKAPQAETPAPGPAADQATPEAMPAPTEPAPPPAQPTAGTPPKKGTPWGWIIGCSCGCLLVVALIIGAMVYLSVQAAKSAQIEGTSPAATGENGQGETTGGETEGGPATTTEDNAAPDIYQPGEGVAKEAALGQNPDWVAKVVEHSSDWKSVTVWIGPPQSEFVGEYKLVWNDSGHYYDIASVTPIEMNEP